jgi:RHS repeat-associated protein
MLPARLLSCVGMAMNIAMSVLLRLFAAVLLLVTLLPGGSAAHAQTVPGTTVTDPAALLAPPDIDNGAAFHSQSVPTTMVAGGRYDVAVTMRNTGAETWTDANNYRLGALSPSDNMTWGLKRVGLNGGTVPYRGLKTFTFQVTAPSAPGTYTFHWGMLQEYREWFGTSSPVTVTVTAPATLANKAEVVAVSTPAQMVSGQAYSMSVTMKNTGTSTWSPAVYKLGAQNPHDNYTWMTANRVSPGRSVGPGEQYQFTFNVKAPAPGSYAMQWQMVQEGEMWFGAISNSAVKVVAPTQTSTPTISVQRNPATMTAGQAFTLTWSTTNASSLKRICTASGTGFAVNESLQTSGASSGTASAAWVNHPSACTWTASGTGGSAQYAETMSTAAVATSGVTYIHTDGLGSPVARTDAAGKVISRTRYEPYGYVATGATPTIGFTGHVNDSDTGLTYMQQRYYDPVAGRFLSIDPVTTDADTGSSFNRYVYAKNSPYKFIDPDGRNAMIACVGGPIPCAVGAAITAVAAIAIVIKGQEVLHGNNNAGPKKQEGTNSALPVPDDYVGVQGEKAGTSVSGNRHTSGPLAPEHGGTGDAQADFDKLTGGTGKPFPEGDKRAGKPGVEIGDNGIWIRPGTKKPGDGQRIEIPGNGNKFPETLHY